MDTTEIFQQILLHSKSYNSRQRAEINKRAYSLLSKNSHAGLMRLYQKVSGMAAPISGHGIEGDKHSTMAVEEVQGQYLVYPQEQSQLFSNYHSPLNQQQPYIAHSYPLYNNFGVDRPKPKYW